MEKIPTAEELINKIDNEFYEKNSYYLSISNPDLFAKTIAIEFAKLHVEEALKEASEKALMEEDWVWDGEEENHVYTGVDKDSIINSYPLDKIK